MNKYKLSLTFVVNEGFMTNKINEDISKEIDKYKEEKNLIIRSIDKNIMADNIDILKAEVTNAEIDNINI